MGFTKIKDEDLARYPGVRGQETVPRISVEEKQAKFEERAEKVLRPAHDRLVDELEAKSAAKSLGAMTEDGEPSNVQDVIDTEVVRAKAAEQAAVALANAAIKSISIEGEKIVYTKNDGSTETIEMPDLSGSLPTGSAETKGIVKLSDSTGGASGEGDGVAATPKAVRKAYDKVSMSLSGTTLTISYNG